MRIIEFLLYFPLRKAELHEPPAYQIDDRRNFAVVKGRNPRQDFLSF